ncbi:UDP-N-acetylmuramoyl-L-alanine--D-glutamate ligase [Candidatus Uhrbacteria bacterium CG10_big_fil_rev_8_21_14_0_10_48_11]|uniref:UDP-N-acetylmuramoylalanine--D-glutamate ligase n=1 Tax=Candidatus Uhrbacteria bacterium CG10_big_fil_rev_8_21_14_0_10_48_11 TaxID=1975037 RepID=A0A2M8LDP4_9BACT|nr:MAG: UDP-N-acetylmuramoyl-L-alanine--D-glutamate ligase [Candidatus Uhrbacteria bacterium CG10_big_fil_rev_8_21_14_0_10_48_11]
MDWRGKKVAVVGFGIEGEANAEYLLAAGALVTVCDKCEAAALGERYQRWQDKVSEWRLGSSYLERLTDFAALFRSPGVPYLDPNLQAVVKEGVVVTSGTKEFFERCPAKIVGITGTKGKGTTATLIYKMLQADGKPAQLVGNIGNPALAVLQNIKKDEIVVFELSSFQLQDLEVSPTLAVVLGVTADHQDHHCSVEEYVAAKAAIVRFQKETDFTVVTVDYPTSEHIASETTGNVLPVSTKRQLEYGVYVTDGGVYRNFGVAESIIENSEVALRGIFNLENVAAAIAVASIFEIATEAIVKVLRSFKGLPHRLAFVRECRGVSYWDNSYATTPEATIAALESFTEPVVLLLGGKEKGFDYTALAKAILSRPPRAIVAIGESAATMYSVIKAAAQKNNSTPPPLLDGGETMVKMVEAASKVATSGDIVLLSPAAASFDKFKNVTDRGEQFVAAVNAF